MFNTLNIDEEFYYFTGLEALQSSIQVGMLVLLVCIFLFNIFDQNEVDSTGICEEKINV
mgnify:CR=1 FL=1|jgi:hypothetical protein